MAVMYRIVEFILTIDLREIFYAAVGAFLGFWLAIVLEKSSTRKKEIETIRSLIKNLLTELCEIEDSILTTSKDRRLIIDLPIYEASIQSGNILAFVDKAYYGRLLKTYSKIKNLIYKETENSEEIERYRNEVGTYIKDTIEEITKTEKGNYLEVRDVGNN